MNDSTDKFRVNVPAHAAEALADGPDTGFALVRFTKDENGYCLDLESLRLPDEQPADAEETTEEDDESELSNEELGRKIMVEEGMEED